MESHWPSWNHWLSSEPSEASLTSLSSACFKKITLSPSTEGKQGWSWRTSTPASQISIIHQFTYHSRHCPFLVHTQIQGHLDNKDTLVRILFIDYSSAFYTTIPTIIYKLLDLGHLPCTANGFLASWLIDPSVWKGDKTSSAIICNAGALQGCDLRPSRYFLYTQGCSNQILF